MFKSKKTKQADKAQQVKKDKKISDNQAVMIT